MQTKILIFLLLFVVYNIDGQKEDHIWLFGYNGNPGSGSPYIDFNSDPPRLPYDNLREWDFGDTNSSICDSTGTILMYSNGMILANSSHSLIPGGGDSISFDLLWQNSFIPQVSWPAGKPIVDLMLILPIPGRLDSYYVFYDLTSDEDVQITKSIGYSIVDFENNSNGRIILKDEKLFNDTLANGVLKACRHANGRDWWLIKANYNRSKFFVFLIDPNGILLSHEISFNFSMNNGGGQSSFSFDGTKFAFHQTFSIGLGETTTIALYDFDRCSGILSNPKYDQSVDAFQTFNLGVSFSRNGNFLYASNSDSLLQYDLFENDLSHRQLIAIGDINGDPERRSFSYLKLGPDNKIYISDVGGGRNNMSVIFKPDNHGLSCELKQNYLQLSSNYSPTMPNIPNFRLGPIDGSECDTLGIDNHPVSKFRYVQDTSDLKQVEFIDLSYFRPEEWTWSFGDGEMSSLQNPVHNYTSNGNYEVCLTVSNENSSNSTCRNLQIGPSSSNEPSQYKIELFPNPVSDVLLVNVLEYLPQEGEISLFNIEGERVFQTELRHGWNSLEVSALTPGMYVFRVEDGKEILKTGKLIKM